MSMKRRAGHAASPDLATPDPPKRIRKRNDDTFFPDHENVKTTQEIGEKIIRLLRKSQDKNGRNVATHFLDLPSRADYPDYYQHIAMPLSLNIIEDKLNNGEYDDMEKLESDLKRMVQNAKDYNSSKSEIFEDAERIRKALSNFMPKHNPAYQNPDYRAYPTPIPQSFIDKMTQNGVATETPTMPEKVKLVFNRGSRRRQSQAVSMDGDEEATEDIEEAQVAVLDELSQVENAINFEEKPSKRDYPEYYKVIEKPVAINDIRRMARKGAFPDWASFAREVRLIWANAKEFNEPGSEIYDMAMELESFFEERVQSYGVPAPVTTRISLSQPRPKQLKLKLGSSTPTPTLPGGTTIDNESLRRQKEERDHALERAARANSRTYTNGATPLSAVPTNIRRSISVTEPSDVPMSGTDGVPATVQAVETVKMPVPPGPANIPTPVMDGEPPRFATAGFVNGDRFVPTTHTGRSFGTDSDNPIERKYRDPGKGLEDALLGSVTYMTHPNLPSDPKWRITRYASATKTQTSSYIYLPADHSYFRVIPTLTPEVRSRRNHRMVVTHNWQMQPSQANSGVFDFKLQPGENVIAVDVIAELREGERKDYAPPQLQLDFERITFYVYLRDRDETR